MDEPESGGVTDKPDVRLAAAGIVGVVTLAAVWFAVSWVVLESTLVDAAGAAFGGVCLVMLLVSIVGSLLRSR